MHLQGRKLRGARYKKEFLFVRRGAGLSDLETGPGVPQYPMNLQLWQVSLPVCDDNKAGNSQFVSARC